MTQILKYGLLQPMRAFKLPAAWTGKQSITVEGMKAVGEAIVHSNEFLGTQHNGEQHTYTVEQNEVSIKREINGDCASHITIYVPDGKTVKIIEEISGSGNLASSTIVIVEANATVEYAILQEMSEDSTCLLNYEGKVRNSKLHWFFCGIGGETSQVNITSDAGNNADVINNAVLFGTGKQQFDVHVATKHTGRGSRSNMLTRSVLDDEARAIYHGLIHIGQNAPDCDSYQKDEVILLSDKAGADAIPNLEIQNNKVRCSHGATIGKFDEEKLFYFRSRGIDKEAAKRMITEGFLESLFIAPWQQKISEKISRSSRQE